MISHPRFYWGETGNVLTTPLFKLPIPSSRALVPTGYGYVLPDQNGWSRYLHFQTAWVLVLTGVLYVIFSFFSGHLWKDLLPGKADLSWRAFSTAVSGHLRFKPPSKAEAWSYNLLQRLTYLFVIFVLFPLMIWTGLAMSPAFVSAVPATVTLLGGHRIALAFSAGTRCDDLYCRIQDPHASDDHGSSGYESGAHMSDISRRKLITTGLAAAAGVSALGVAARMAQKYGLVPPDHGGIYGLGETLTYASQRLLTRHSLAREFRRNQISKIPLANEMAPPNEAFKRLQSGGFADWRLSVDGLVDRPASFSLDQLKSYPIRSQITQLACEEGWSYIAEWIGAPLSHVLEVVGTQPKARYVVYFSIEPDWWESIDMADALHPQTFLAYGMNGNELPVGNGGPLRLRLPRQLGYKSVKFITHLTVTDSLKGFGKGLGSASPEAGYAWYAGI